MKAKVLIVDDSSVSRRLVQGYLEAAGHEVTEAYDSMPALDQFTLEKPDMVQLDLVMSGMGGLEVLQKLRETDSQARVIVTTADIQNSTRNMATQAGSCAFLNKPIRREELSTAVNSSLEGLNQ